MAQDEASTIIVRLVELSLQVPITTNKMNKIELLSKGSFPDIFHNASHCYYDRYEVGPACTFLHTPTPFL